MKKRTLSEMPSTYCHTSNLDIPSLKVNITETSIFSFSITKNAISESQKVNALLGRLSSHQTTTGRRIHSDGEPLEVRPSQTSQLSASLDRIINTTWENTDQDQGLDLQEMMNNDSQEVELFRTGDLVDSL